MRLIPAAAVAALSTVFLLAQGQSQPPFIFKKADLNLLEECEALDLQLEKRALIYHHAALEKRLTSLALPLLPSTPLEHVQWKFNVLREPAVIAFAFANGSIYISTGLLARAENDDQVAGTMAHEIAHVAYRHLFLFTQALRKKTVETHAGAVAAYVVGGITATAFVEAAGGGPGKTGTMTAVLGYGRSFEHQADQAAVESLKVAGRDPVQLLRLALIVDDKLEPEPVPIVGVVIGAGRATTKDRVEYLKDLPGLDINPGPQADDGYLDRMRALILQNIQLDLDTRRFRSAVAGAQRLASAYPDDAVALFWLGESYRSLGPRQARLTPEQLTGGKQRAAYRQTVGHSEEDVAKSLASTPAGNAALEANQQNAERLFRKAASVDPSFPEPYFGLGSLYEQQGRKEPAIEAYRKYIDLCQQPADRDRARRRVEELTKGSQASPK